LSTLRELYNKAREQTNFDRIGKEMVPLKPVLIEPVFIEKAQELLYLTAYYSKKLIDCFTYNR